jgi:hypothetical protein
MLPVECDTSLAVPQGTRRVHFVMKRHTWAPGLLTPCNSLKATLLHVSHHRDGHLIDTSITGGAYIRNRALHNVDCHARTAP